MKNITIVFVFLIGVSAFAQKTIKDTIIDGKSAKKNTTTGVYTFVKEVSSEAKKDDVNISITSTSEKNTTKDKVNLIHVVSKGETLYSISNKYQISLAQIKSLNKLKSNVLSLNQELEIGYNTSAEVKPAKGYTIKKGDTLFSIAKNHNLTVQELKTLNNLVDNNINVGQVLILK
jgi:LysM repeat protein